MALGELQADILGVLQKLGRASARDIVKVIGPNKKLAYTTVSTVLDRLYRKGLVKRSRITGRGGSKYVYVYATSPDVRDSLVQRVLNQLVNAFGPSIVPTIYESLDQLSREEKDNLKDKLAKARR